MVQLSHLNMTTGRIIAFTRFLPFLSFIEPIFAWNVPLVSNFLKGISSLSHSIVFLYLFALITEEGFLISPCYSLKLCIQMGISFFFYFAIHFNSVSQPCPTLCSPMNCSTPGLPVYHQLPEFTQTHVHRVSDAIQPSHPLSSPSPPAPIPPSIRVFSNESTLRMRWPKYWSLHHEKCWAGGSTSWNQDCREK